MDISHGFEPKWSWDTVVTALGFFFALLTYYLQGRRDAQDNRRDTYQKLELASNDLFRFEAQTPAVVEGLYFKGKLPADNTVERAAVQSYVFQILNLFEMAVRFREEGVMPPDVFGSWVIWFHDLCCAENFPALWPGMKWNYLPALRGILTNGIALESSGDNDDTCQKFFDMVAAQVGDPSIKDWLRDQTAAARRSS
jgi:hypothetical protein